MKIDSIRIGYVDVPICLEDLHEDDCFGYFVSYPKPKIAIHDQLTPLYTAATKGVAPDPPYVELALIS